MTKALVFKRNYRVRKLTSGSFFNLIYGNSVDMVKTRDLIHDIFMFLFMGLTYNIVQSHASKVIEGHRRSWKVMEGFFLTLDRHFRWEKLWVLDRSVSPSQSPFCNSLWTLKLRLRFGLVFGTWILDIGMDSGLIIFFQRDHKSYTRLGVDRVKPWNWVRINLGLG